MGKSLHPDADHDYTMHYDLLDSLSIIVLLISVSNAHALLQPLECLYYIVLFFYRSYGIFCLPLLDIHVYIQFTMTHMAPLLTGHRPSQTAPPNQ